jgi:hypothetical protein
MRRIIALVGSIALLTALFASPVTAAGGPPGGYDVVSHSTSATAIWASCVQDGDTWVCSDLALFGWNGFDIGDDAVARGDTVCATLFQNAYDVDTEQLLDEQLEFGCSADGASFTAANDLSSASLAGSVELTGYHCVYELGNPDEPECTEIGPREVSFAADVTATGPIEKVKNRTVERSFGPDGKCHLRDVFSGTRRAASATGTFDGDALGFTADARIRTGTGQFAEWCS